MGYKTVPTSTFIKFLKYKGLVYKRTKGDHEIWDYPNGNCLLRPVTFIGKEKDIPNTHIKTNLKTLNISYTEFLKDINNL